MGDVQILSENPVNPIGQAKMDSVMDYVKGLLVNWNKQTQGVTSWISGVNFSYIIKYLLVCLDGLIVFVDNLIDNGPDKKATVLKAIESLYDHMVAGKLPIWIKPWAGGIKAFIIYTIISIAIDFIVSKYKSGAWKKV